MIYVNSSPYENTSGSNFIRERSHDHFKLNLRENDGF